LPGANNLIADWNLLEFIFYTIIYLIAIITIFFVFPYLIVQGVYDGFKYGWTSKIEERLFKKEMAITKVIFALFALISSIYHFFINGSLFNFYWSNALNFLY